MNLASLDNLKSEMCLGGAKLVDQQVSRHLVCAICNQVFLDPMRLSCGHTFCEGCVIIYQNNDKTSRMMLNTCPDAKCQKVLNYNLFQRNIVASNLIRDLEVYCQNSRCEWKGNFNDYKKHRKEECIGSQQSKIGNKITSDIIDLKSEIMHAQQQIIQKLRNQQMKQNQQKMKAQEKLNFLSKIMNDPQGSLSIEELQQRYLNSIETPMVTNDELNKNIKDVQQDSNKIMKRNQILVSLVEGDKNQIISFDSEFQKKYFSHILRQGQKRLQAGVRINLQNFNFGNQSNHSIEERMMEDIQQNNDLNSRKNKGKRNQMQVEQQNVKSKRRLRRS